MALTLLEEVLMETLAKLIAQVSQRESLAKPSALKVAVADGNDLIRICKQLQNEEQSEPSVGQLASDLERIQSLLSAAQSKFNQLDSRIVDWMLSVHNTETSLPHVLRWGPQVAEGLSQEVGTMKDLTQMGISNE